MKTYFYNSSPKMLSGKQEIIKRETKEMHGKMIGDIFIYRTLWANSG